MKKEVNKQEIIDHIDHYYNYLTQQYHPKSIVAIAAQGIYNYRLAKSHVPFHCAAIMLSSYQELCLTNQMINKQFQLTDHRRTDLVDLLDIRLFRQGLMKQNLSYLEMINTDYIKINEEYTNLFNKYFINNNFNISYYNNLTILNNLCQQVKDLIADSKFSYTTYYEINRLYTFFKHYLKQQPFYECMTPIDSEFDMLWQLKWREPFVIQSKEEMLKISNNILTDMRAQALNAQSSSGEMRHKAVAALNEGTVKILTKSFTGEVPSLISETNFINILTPAQKRAYQQIKESLVYNDYINIKELVLTTKVAEDAYRDTLKKMSDYNIAKIERLSTDRTYIRMTNDE